MDAKELLSGVLSKTLNMDETGVASLFNEDGTVKENALNVILDKDATRVKTLKPDTKKLFDDGYKKAQSEVLSKLEKDFKEQTGFESELKGVELFTAYAETKESSTNKESLTEDAVKKHPSYISAIDKLKKEKKDAEEKLQKELTDFKMTVSQKETFSKVSSKALEIFNGLKPVLSKDPAKAKNQMDDFIMKLQSYSYEIQGDRIVILKDGKPYEDDHGHAKTFDVVVKEVAERYYDFLQTEERQGTGNGKEDKGGNGQGTKKELKVPTNEKEYTAMLMSTEYTTEEKTSMQKTYKEKAVGQTN